MERLMGQGLQETLRDPCSGPGLQGLSSVQVPQELYIKQPVPQEVLT